MASSQAAWLKELKAKPLEVSDDAIPKPQANEILVENHAIAINPVDWKMQDSGAFVQKYPHVLGNDVAGVVVEVGSEVKAFKKGDRVISHVVSIATAKPENGGFRTYTAAFDFLSSHLPDNISFVDGSVLPLAISTAAAGMYGEMGLPFPSLSPRSSGKVIILWGGSSSIGTACIQLCKASGIDVIATASAHNFELCKDLGATKVLDYRQSSIVDDLVSAVKASGKDFEGVYDAISESDTISANAEVLRKLGAKKPLTLVLGAENPPSDIELKSLGAFNLAFSQKAIAEEVWVKYIPAALKQGSFKPSPEALIAGEGLGDLQKAMDVQKKGVSAKKVVVKL